MAQRPLQRRRHLHVAELPNGEVEVLQGLGALVRVVVQKQLCEVEPFEGDLGTESYGPTNRQTPSPGEAHLAVLVVDDR